MIDLSMLHARWTVSATSIGIDSGTRVGSLGLRMQANTQAEDSVAVAPKDAKNGVPAGGPGAGRPRAPNPRVVNPPPSNAGFEVVLDGALAMLVCLVTIAMRAVWLQYPMILGAEKAVIDQAAALSDHVFDFNVHPPLARVLQAGMIRYMHFVAELAQVPSFDLQEANVIALRAVNLGLGGFAAAALFLLARLLGISRVCSLLAASFAVLDPMHAILSRTALTREMLGTVLVQCSFLLLLWFLRGVRRDHLDDRSNKRVSKAGRIIRRLFLIACLAAVCAQALLTTWSGGSGIFLFVVIGFFGIWPFVYRPLPMYEIAFGKLVFATMYVITYALFMSNTRCVPEEAVDTIRRQFSLQFRSGLVDCSAADDEAIAQKFGSVLDVHFPLNLDALEWVTRGSYEYHDFLARNVSQRTALSGPRDVVWYSWILNLNNASIHTESVLSSKGDVESRVHGVFNPVMSASVGFLGFVFVFTAVIVGRLRKSVDARILAPLVPRLSIGAVLCLGWLASMLPFFTVFKGGPAFEYFPALFFAQLLTALTVDLMGRPIHVVVSIMLMWMQVLCYGAYAPWIYALPLRRGLHQMLAIVPNWWSYIDNSGA
ncbi:hypothetical protein FVE85_0868 [Porphyridium purpureum]|uniref:Uncharacterized protein n=1 Tax=Porphyridium purpureum TaxID=35688 RepID=A0A5J4YZT7_PORPP|nr:hypothetical protein FVE85_0868 [Porphyridium purpureum]|eukprot:POR5621..scf208_2